MAAVKQVAVARLIIDHFYWEQLACTLILVLVLLECGWQSCRFVALQISESRSFLCAASEAFQS